MCETHAQIAEGSHLTFLDFQGVPSEVDTDILVFDDFKYSFCKIFSATVVVSPRSDDREDEEDEEDGQVPILGRVRGVTIDRTSKEWKRFLRHRFYNYDRGNLRYFSSPDEDIDDLTRIMWLLFNENGNVSTTIECAKEMLEGTTPLHYIPTLQVRPDMVGRKIGRFVFQSYLAALANVDNGYSHTGPIILTPAPIMSGGCSCENCGKPEVEVEVDVDAVIKKLRDNTYKPLGFHVCVDGERTGGMTIMVRPASTSKPVIEAYGSISNVRPPEESDDEGPFDE